MLTDFMKVVFIVEKMYFDYLFTLHVAFHRFGLDQANNIKKTCNTLLEYGVTMYFVRTECSMFEINFVFKMSCSNL